MNTAGEKQAEYLVNAETDDTEIEIAHRDPVKEVGFAAIDHVVTLDNRLSDGAYRTYATLYYFWKNKKTMWASTTTLAGLRDLKESTILSHVRELLALKMVSRSRRLGQSSLIHLENPSEEQNELALEILQRQSYAKLRKNSTQPIAKPILDPTQNPAVKDNQERESLKESTSAEKPPAPKKEKATIPLPVAVFREVRRSYPCKESYESIVSTVGDNPTALDLWRKVLIGWAAMGWNPRNVDGALGFFKRGEIPHSNGNGNGKGYAHKETQGESWDRVFKQAEAILNGKQRTYPEDTANVIDHIPNASAVG